MASMARPGGRFERVDDDYDRNSSRRASDHTTIDMSGGVEDEYPAEEGASNFLPNPRTMRKTLKRAKDINIWATYGNYIIAAAVFCIIVLFIYWFFVYKPKIKRMEEAEKKELEKEPPPNIKADKETPPEPSQPDPDEVLPPHPANVKPIEQQVGNKPPNAAAPPPSAPEQSAPENLVE